MSIEKVIAGFLRVAAEDLQGARALAKIANRNAIYLCSQAAEKVIRAVLTSEGTHAGVGHKLDRMVDSVPDVNPVKKILREIQGLEIYATSYRYPTTVGKLKPVPDLAEFERFADKVEMALQSLLARRQSLGLIAIIVLCSATIRPVIVLPHETMLPECRCRRSSNLPPRGEMVDGLIDRSSRVTLGIGSSSGPSSGDQAMIDRVGAYVLGTRPR